MKFEPLKGITVISIEQALSAPLASCRLADAGARVIKVERESGDFARDYDRVVNGLSTYFVWANRGKESVRINLKSDEGKALLLRMISNADVLIQNLVPGAMKRLGMSSEDMRKQFPELITCDISGYGEEGEYAERKAYDNLLQAETGFIDVTGDGDVRAKAGISLADISTAMHAYAAILEAIIERKRTGKGVGITISMFDSMADWMMVPYLHQKYGGKTPPRTGIYHAAIAPYGPFETDGGREIMIGIQNEREWEAFCNSVLEGDIKADDKRFKRNSDRVENVLELNTIIQKRFQRLSYKEALEKLRTSKIAYANVNTLKDLVNHPQLRLTEVNSETGPVKIADRVARYTGYETVSGSLPALGEHDEKIKKEFEK
jgi:itaconate CoA-transferase